MNPDGILPWMPLEAESERDEWRGGWQYEAAMFDNEDHPFRDTSSGNRHPTVVDVEEQAAAIDQQLLGSGVNHAMVKGRMVFLNQAARVYNSNYHHQYRLSQPLGVTPTDLSQPQGVTPPDRSQPQRIASPDRSQPQGVTPPDWSQPQGVTPPDWSKPQRIASPDRSQLQRIASPDRSQPQGITPPDRSQPQGVTSLDRSQLQGIPPPQQIHPRRITLPGRVQSPRTACPDRSQTHGVARPKRLQPKRATRSDRSQSTGITPLDKNGPLKKTHPDRNQSRQIVPYVRWQSQGTSPKLCQFLSQLPEIAQPHSGNSKQRTPADHGQCHRNTSGDQRQPRRKAPANQGCCRENLTSFHGERQQSTSPCSLPSACMRSKNCTFLITDPSTQMTQTTRSQMHTPLAADCAVELVGQGSAPGYNMQCDSDDSMSRTHFKKRKRPLFTAEKASGAKVPWLTFQQRKETLQPFLENLDSPQTLENWKRYRKLKAVKVSRMHMGCSCVGKCQPGTCECLQNGIPCHHIKKGSSKGGGCRCSKGKCANKNTRYVGQKKMLKAHYKDVFSRLHNVDGDYFPEEDEEI
ncbi:hypothetical protein ACOMHN_059852 [Nucella lapillus]